MAEWQLLADAEAVAREACAQICAAADFALQDHGRFSLVLAGGTTPRRTYQLLAETEQQWDRWCLYYGDERCLPIDDLERNSCMVRDTGLAALVGLHAEIPAELGAEPGAASYSEIIQAALPFDMVLLGIGEDGHTASLFPGHHWSQQAVLAVHHSPKPPLDRVSLSVSTLQAARQLLILVTGQGKREAVKAWRAGEYLPIAAVAAVNHARVLADADVVNSDR